MTVFGAILLPDIKILKRKGLVYRGRVYFHEKHYPVTVKKTVIMQLRDYQERLISDLRGSYASGKKHLIMQLPTGGGKTAVFSEITRLSTERGGRVLIVTDRTELHRQGGDALKRIGVTYRELTAKTKVLDPAHVVVAMVETLKRRLNKPDYAAFVKSFNMIIIDEAHKNTFNKLFESLETHQLVLGATATPIRTGNMRPLKADYDGIVLGPEISELIDSGYLAPEKPYGYDIDLSTVRITAGDFNEQDMGRVFSQKKVVDGVIENWEAFAKKRKTLAFCPTVESSRNLADEFAKSGYKSAHIDALTPDYERKKILNFFADGEYDVLCNCGILTTGYDCASIECIILYRATMSLPLFLQMTGRGSRPHKGKDNFVLLDFGGNIQRHGFWHNPRKWSLEIVKTNKIKEKGVAKSFECPECHVLIPKNTKKCQYCGWEKEISMEEKLVVKLQEMSSAEVIRYSETANVEELERIRTAKEWKVGFVLHRLKTMSEFKEYELLKRYQRGWAWRIGNRYLNLNYSWDDWYGKGN